mmetsp:Transcript_3898/g.12606  ORF Transcript_3898/g.12606 Transcript_3898/m.12606 type:complete len:265 (+) Transcript_3898:130-924(+)
MGPPHPAWQHKTAVFRHTGKMAHEMLTQCVDKAPKWSFNGRPKDHTDQATTAGPIAVNDNCRRNRDPTYSFGPPGGPNAADKLGSKRGFGRPISAPPGPEYVPLGPTTPQYSFGTTKRGCPFPDMGNNLSPGPAAFNDPRVSRGPKFSMEPRRGSSRHPDGPGPGGFVPKHPGGATHAPHWGKPKPRDGDRRPDSLGASGGGGGSKLYSSFGGLGGPSYSLGARRGTEIGMGDGGQGPGGRNNTRDLGPSFTHFGYNDFGRATH